MAERFPNLMKDVNINIHGAKEISSRMNSKRHTDQDTSSSKFERQRQRDNIESTKREANHDPQ